jgi:hypothetical protein
LHIQLYQECHFVGKSQWIKDHFLCPENVQSTKFNGGYYGS